jgi:hypothetical protein
MNVGTVLGGATAALQSIPAAASGAVTALAGAGRPAASGSLLGTLFGRLAQPLANGLAEQLGSLLSRFLRGAFSGSGDACGCVGTSSSSASGSLAFLKDPRLSVEEKLARLMIHMSDKYDKELEKKMQQLADLESGKATGSSKSGSSSGSSESSGGFLSSLTSGIGSLFSKVGLGNLFGEGGIGGVLGQIAGPVLSGAATALGMGGIAGLILKGGSLLGGLFSGATSGASGTTSSGTSASSKKATSSSGTSGKDGPSEKQLMTEIQILQEKQKQMFTLVSNVLRSLHDTKMAVINNLR